MTFRDLLAAILLSACTLVSIPGSASEAVLEALLKRGLVPFAPWYAAEVAYAWPGGDDGMPGTGNRARVPQAIPSGLILIRGPDGAVIANVTNDPGPLALSVEAAQAIGLEGGRETTITLIALRQLFDAGVEPQRPEFGQATAPVPQPRPQLRTEDNVLRTPTPRPASRSPVPAAEIGALEPVVESDGGRGVDPGQGSQDDTATASRSPGAPDGTLSLQAGYFSVEANARQLLSELRALNIPGRVFAVQNAAGSPRWRVVAGPFPDETSRAAAKRAGGKLLAEAYPIRMPR